jgi:hypothetical protein
MRNMLEPVCESYASWLADCEDGRVREACLNHARTAGATDEDIARIENRAYYLRIARTYGECHA